MKSIIFRFSTITLFLLLVVFSSCEDGLDVTNPNEPTPEVLNTEQGIERQALGLWNNGGGWTEWVIWMLLEGMGDNVVQPWGNFDWNAFVLPIEEIAFSDGETIKVSAVRGAGRTQEESIDFVNDRNVSQGSIDQMWIVAYAQINDANLLLQALDEGVSFTGDAAAKESAYRSWANYWKAFSYMQVGLLYEGGLIVDEPGQTNENFADNSELIAESNRLFDAALQGADNFNIISNIAIPGIFPTNVTPESYRQTINTLKARNILLSQRREDVSGEEWQEILSLTQNGLTSNVGTFVVESDESTFLAAVTARFRLATNVWHRVSPRVIQVMAENNDNRLNNFFFADAGGNFDNETVIQHVNSPWITVDGSPYASTTAGAPQYFVSAEENLLMQAEAQLALGNPGEAGALIDQARAMQDAGLPAVGNATLNDIKNERKVGLFMRALAFYDARRFGNLDPKAEGGGVRDVWVYKVDPSTGAARNNLDEEADIYFNFIDYLPIPDVETDFNPLPDQNPFM